MDIALLNIITTQDIYSWIAWQDYANRYTSIAYLFTILGKGKVDVIFVNEDTGNVLDSGEFDAEDLEHPYIEILMEQYIKNKVKMILQFPEQEARPVVVVHQLGINPLCSPLLPDDLDAYLVEYKMDI